MLSPELPVGSNQRLPTPLFRPPRCSDPVVPPWPKTWLEALKGCFPEEWQELAGRVGEGLRELLEDGNALEDARKTTDVGLLSGMEVSAEMLKASGERLLLDVIEPLADLARD